MRNLKISIIIFILLVTSAVKGHGMLYESVCPIEKDIFPHEAGAFAPVCTSKEMIYAQRRPLEARYRTKVTVFEGKVEVISYYGAAEKEKIILESGEEYTTRGALIVMDE